MMVPLVLDDLRTNKLMEQGPIIYHLDLLDLTARFEGQVVPVRLFVSIQSTRGQEVSSPNLDVPIALTVEPARET